MIDPITAVTAATAAFNGIKQMVNAGKEIEDIAQHLGKWYGAAADMSRAEARTKNPPLFKKLFASGSVEEEAMAIFINKKKIQEQEQELRSIISFRYGPQAWEDLIQLRRKIRKEREETIYRQQELRQELIDNAIVIAGVIAIGLLLFGMLYFVGAYKSWF